jgi:hypothetical protein
MKFPYTILLVIGIATTFTALAQLGTTTNMQTQASTNLTVTSTNMGPATLQATLVEPTLQSKNKAATVNVAISGIQLVEPPVSAPVHVAGQGHLHYQLDNLPMIATTSTNLGFHGLSSGSHQITVMLAGNDHRPLGPQSKLTVQVP